MPAKRNQNNRIFGTTSKSDSNRVGVYIDRSLTDEQRAQRQAETQAAYDTWARQRRARLAKKHFVI